MLSTLSWAVRHEANRGRRVRAAAVWARHNVAKRLRPGPTSRTIGGAVVEGPWTHPTICLTTYATGGLYDWDAMNGLAAVLRPGDTFVDVGASIGAYACLAATLVGTTGHVLAFEPDGTDRAWLARNLVATGTPHRIVAQPVADAVRRMAFTTSSPTLHHLADDPQGTLETTTLDHVVEGADVFVKIDVEGWDGAVIAGAAETLRRGVRGLLFEASGLDRSHVAWTSVVDLLHDAGLTVCWPFFEAGRVDVFDDPPPASPTANYFALPETSLSALRTAVAQRRTLARSTP